jgi:ribosomal protein L1
MAATTIAAQQTIELQMAAIQAQLDILKRELRLEVNIRLPNVGGATVTTAITAANAAIISATSAIATAIAQL